MKTLRWLFLFGALLVMAAALPALAQDTEPDHPLAGLWSFFGITGEMLDDAQTASHAAAAEGGLRELMATLPQWRTEDGAFVIGDADAPFTLVEFADWACPHCITYQQEVVDPFIVNHVATGQAAFEFRPFPTAGRDITVAAAQLAECAETFKPGAFWDLYPTLYEMAAQGVYSIENMFSMMTARLEITENELVACVVDWEQNHGSPQQIFADYEFATAMGINGTPAVLVRFNGGEAEVLEWAGTVFDQGGVPLEVLAEVVASVQPE